MPRQSGPQLCVAAGAPPRTLALGSVQGRAPRPCAATAAHAEPHAEPPPSHRLHGAQGSEAFLIDRWRQYVQGLMVDLVPGIVLGSVSAAGFLAFVAWVRRQGYGALNHRPGPRRACVVSAVGPPSAWALPPRRESSPSSCRRSCAGGGGAAYAPQGWQSGRLGRPRQQQQPARHGKPASRLTSSSLPNRRQRWRML